MSPQAPEIAVVCPKALTALGLQSLLAKIIPQATVSLFERVEELQEASVARFFHFFVSEELVASCRPLLAGSLHRVILLVDGDRCPEGFHSVNIRCGEADLVGALMRLHHTAHHPVHPDHPGGMPRVADPDPLTPREREVLTLIARGLQNKEIADCLGIGLTTVISHRRNISEKLGIRTVAALAVYAFRYGYIDR